MEDIIDIIVTETTNLIEITSQPTDEIIDVNIIDNREDVTLNVTPTLVEININSLVGNFGILWGEIEGTLSNQTDLQNTLNLKADLVDGKVPSSQLPSYVDDVVEVANYAALPVTGEVGKIYITLDTNYIYRWTGSVYVEIKDSSAVWGAITGTLSNQTDLQNALNAKLSTSTAASTYVPYTGATGNVNLGLDYSLTAALIIKSGGTSTQFLKADGSIDSSTYLTTSSAASTYLPLTGGTLTGNLLGTNITISNSLIAKGGTFNGGALSGGVVTIDGLGSDLLMNRADTSNGASITLLTNAVEKWNIGLRSAGTTDNFFIYNSNLTANALTINSATSAATFASSATATNFILSGGTGNTGLYYGHTDRVVLANYTTGGIDFEVNGGSIVATLFPSGNYGLGVALDAGYKLDVNGTTRISGALSGTSATFSGAIQAGGSVISGNSNNFYNTASETSVLIKQTSGAAFITQALWNNATTGDNRFIRFFGETAATNRGGIIYNRSSDKLNLVGEGGGLLFTGASTFSSTITSGDLITALGTSTAGFVTSLLVKNPSTNAASAVKIGFDGGGTTWGEIGASYNSNSPYMAFFVRANSEKMRITDTGNVGIGTTSPASKLHIEGTGTGAWLTINRTDTGSNIVDFTQSSTRLGYIGYIGNDLNINNATASNLVFRTSDTERMRITSGGNVLIGTTTDSGYKLLVNGTFKSNALWTDSSSLGYWGNSGTAYGGFTWDTGYATVFATGGNNLRFGADGSSPKMILTTAGNVGIGTTSPANYTNYITQTINGTNGAIVQLQSSGTPSLRLIGEGVDSYLDNVSTGALIFRTTSSSSERMRIGATGFTASVKGASDSESKTFMDSVSSNCGLIPTMAGTTLYLYGRNSGTNYRALLTASTYFTGQHGNKVVDLDLKENIENYVGMIVSSDGTYYSVNPITNEITTGKDAISISESLPQIKLTNKDKDKSIWGVVTNVKNDNYNTDGDIETDNNTEWGDRLGENVIRVNGLGEGAIWVTNINGNLENGDYICSSIIPGFGRKQDDDLLHNYSVAKITMDCDFDLNNDNLYKCEEFEFEGQTYKKAFVGCTYHCS